MAKYFSKLACLLLTQLVWQEKKSALHLVSVKAATCYVKGVQGARQGVIGYLGLCLMRFILGFGLVLLHLGLLLYLPWSTREKGLLLLILGVLYTALAVVAFAVVLSQRTWMKATRADEVVRCALRKRP
ncbi:MAG: hypothetical protein PHO37_04590 [Kiritimatiellae bacterium]|nr:hypothetical protein [Kiritimatiellia bacterium]